MFYLLLVIGERFFVMKYIMCYFNFVIIRNIWFVVIIMWVLFIVIEIFGNVVIGLLKYFVSLVVFILMSCILFIVFFYVILFGEICCY